MADAPEAADAALVADAPVANDQAWDGPGAVDQTPDTAVEAAAATCGPTLLVVAVGSSDTPLLEQRLSGLGCTVTLRLDTELRTGDGEGMALVIISESINSTLLGSKLLMVGVPVLVMEAFVYADMGMTGPVKHTDYGEAPQTRTVEIVQPAHELAGGLSGTVNILPASWTGTWGRPSPAGLVIATLGVGDDRAMLFAYDRGASMPGLAAPARRVGYAPLHGPVSGLSAEGWALFDAAVRWAVKGR